jgi:hypothetical protein
MKKFFDNIFKPYLFPVILLVVGAYIKTAENLDFITKYFSDTSNKFLNFFNHQFYLWELIFYIAIMFFLLRLYRFFFKRQTRRHKLMLKAIKNIGTEKPINITGTTDKFLFKFKPIVEEETYVISELHPYCQNCSNHPIRMTEQGYGDFRCNCGKQIDYRLCRDVESRIISEIEINEKHWA